MSTSNLPYCIDRRAGYQGSRPSLCGQAEVEKSVTGHHYSEVTFSGWLKSKRHRTHYNSSFYHNICIGSINTRTMKDPMKLAQCISQCKFLKNDITIRKLLVSKTLLFSNDHKKYARDRWLKIEKELNISKIQIQRLMQNKRVHVSSK